MLVENTDNNEDEVSERFYKTTNVIKLFISPKVKPLTILITRDIKAAKQLPHDFLNF